MTDLLDYLDQTQALLRHLEVMHAGIFRSRDLDVIREIEQAAWWAWNERSYCLDARL